MRESCSKRKSSNLLSSSVWLISLSDNPTRENRSDLHENFRAVFFRKCSREVADCNENYHSAKLRSSLKRNTSASSAGCRCVIQICKAFSGEHLPPSLRVVLLIRPSRIGGEGGRRGGTRLLQVQCGVIDVLLHATDGLFRQHTYQEIGECHVRHSGPHQTQELLRQTACTSISKMSSFDHSVVSGKEGCVVPRYASTCCPSWRIRERY